MLSVYRRLLHLYPPTDRHEYGEEMMDVFREVQGEGRNKTVAARGWFCAREIGGLLGGALRQHVRAIAGFHPPLFPSRRFSMQSEFRFPKATPWLMAIILAVVVAAIEKAKAIQASVPDVRPHLGPIQPEGFTFLPTLLMLLAVACGAGVLGWAILFALRRSGLHRLSELNPSSNRSSRGGLSV